LKKWLKIALAFVFTVAIVFVGISGYLGYSMTRVPRVPLKENPGVYGLTYEDVAFPSMDKGLILRGWFIPVQNSEQVHYYGTWQWI
jgi:hypothetical protein